jgi:hypothetical protein
MSINLADGFKSNGNVISYNPYWIIAIFRRAFPTTYSRKTLKSIEGDFDLGVQIRGDPLILTDDVLSLSVNSNKSNFLSHFNASLAYSGVPYDLDIFPGDYAFCWIVNSKEKYLENLQKITNGERVNQFDSGLKFFGQIEGCRRRTVVGDGEKHVSFTITGRGNKEYGHSIFWDPHLESSFRENSIAENYTKLGLDVGDLIQDEFPITEKNYGGLSVNKSLAAFLNLFFGKGIPLDRLLQIEGQPNQQFTGAEYERPYILPKQVGKIFGIEVGGVLKYTDILRTLIGVQKYEQTNVSATDNVNSSMYPTRLLPMLGDIATLTPNITNRSIWNVLGDYLNPAMNEHYVTLQADRQSDIVPHYVARQIPFTTELFQPPEEKNIETTKFLSLPKWVVDSRIVLETEIGRSITGLFNFCHVYGSNSQPSGDEQTQILINTPIRDDKGVSGSGLAAHMSTVPASLKSVISGDPKVWMATMADYLFGGHLVLNGHIKILGTQLPISIGQNISMDNAVFHIEAITHSCSIEPDGTKSFLTDIAVSNGMNDQFELSLNNSKSDIQIYVTEYTSLNESLPQASLVSTEKSNRIEQDDFNRLK